MTETQNTENPFEYNYEEGVMVEIPGTLLHALITYLKQTEENNQEYGFSHTYDKSAKAIKDGKLVTQIETERADYPTMTAYMNQPGTRFTTMPGVIAMDLNHGLIGYHQKAIKEGKAKKLGTVNEEVKLS